MSAGPPPRSCWASSALRATRMLHCTRSLNSGLRRLLRATSICAGAGKERWGRGDGEGEKTMPYYTAVRRISWRDQEQRARHGQNKSTQVGGFARGRVPLAAGELRCPLTCFPPTRASQSWHSTHGCCCCCCWPTAPRLSGRCPAVSVVKAGKAGWHLAQICGGQDEAGDQIGTAERGALARHRARHRARRRA